MDDNTKQVLELLKFHTADDLKKNQTKFTKTANSIKCDAIHGRLSALYTSKELEILSQAVGILNGTKYKIEHAKEVAQREEKRQERLEEEYKIKGQAIIVKHINFESMADDEILIMYCVLNHYDNLYKYTSEDIEELFKHPDRYQFVLNNWKSDIAKELHTKFPFLEEPKEETITNFLRDYKLKKRNEITERYSSLIERFNTFVAIKNESNIELLRK